MHHLPVNLVAIGRENGTAKIVLEGDSSADCAAGMFTRTFHFIVWRCGMVDTLLWELCGKQV